MKYANLMFKGRGRQTLGDQMQLIAIDRIYEEMGFNLERDVVYIDKNDLATYDGEEVVLPISLALVDYVEHGWAGRFSSKIRPLFLGITLAREFLYPEEVEYFNRMAPIGCRDERTFRTMRKYSVCSYFAGCITCTLRRRKEDPNRSKIFVVDAPDEVWEQIPEDKRSRAVRISHLVDGCDDPKKVAGKLLKMYQDEAALIITSLLHCSSPCMAMGIPVILVKSLISYRFGWIDKLLPIYGPKDVLPLEQTAPVDMQNVDESMRTLVMKRLRNPYAIFPEMEDISAFWINREHCHDYQLDCFVHYKEFIDRKFAAGETEFSVWGLTQMSEMVVDYIRTNYPQAKLMAVYDKFRSVEFFGLRSVSPDAIRGLNGCLLVTTLAATPDVMRLCREGILKRDNVCIMTIYY